MSIKFTRHRRQEIVREFATRHNGQYSPMLFVEEVRSTGADHPAWSWFEWDVEKAAHGYQVWQAREFASGLRVSFTVEEIGRNRAITVREVEMPLVMSPMDGRDGGGGYFLSDPANPSHMAEYCRQGAAALAAWLRRYEGAIAHAGGSVAVIQKQLALLSAAVPADGEDKKAA